MTCREYFELVLPDPICKMVIRKFIKYHTSDTQIDSLYLPKYTDCFYLQDTFTPSDIKMLKDQDSYTPAYFIHKVPNTQYDVDAWLGQKKRTIEQIKDEIFCSELDGYSKCIRVICQQETFRRPELRNMTKPHFGAYYIGDHEIPGLDTNKILTIIRK